MTGELVGIGLGPGDPELLTLKAVRALGRMDVIAIISSRSGRPLAEPLALPHLRSDARVLRFESPMREDAPTRRRFYDRLAATLAEELEQGRHVGVPCLGDPLFYGSFGHLLDRLAEHFSCSVVPGVTAVQAASASLGVPVCRGHETLSVLPAVLPDRLLETRIRASDQVVVLKAGPHLPRLRAVLERSAEAFDAWMASEVGMAGERCVPLAEWREPVAPYMSLLMLRRRSPERP